MDTLSGSIERITFYNPENGYSVLRVLPDNRRTPGKNRAGLVTVVGNLPELSEGVHLKLSGKWVKNPTYGKQFQVEKYEQTQPTTSTGIQRYLGSHLIKGIGPRLAERIVQQFGSQTLEVIENQPERLREVPDIGPKRARMIANAWETQAQVKEIMLFLHSYGVSTSLAVKINQQYGDQAMQIVGSDPYRLARDIHGVGFKTADRIAQAMGLPADHPSRLEAGIVYALNQAIDQGHVFLPYQGLVNSAENLLSAAAEQIKPAIKRLTTEDIICQDKLPLSYSPEKIHSHSESLDPMDKHDMHRVCYLKPLYHTEVGLARQLSALAKAWPTRLSDLPPAFVGMDSNLSSEQLDAVRTALSSPVSVLTGGPGTGKTTAIKALIAALESGRKTYALTSPTGRAAKRLAQATDHQASTIHRLLGYSPAEGFKYNSDKPLLVDLVVVDEASMLDLSLAQHLVKALPQDAHLLLVGDVDQLPPVGAGDVLRDVINSQLVPVTRLNTVFRQASHSQIITNAHLIRQGNMPEFISPSHTQMRDFFLFPSNTPEEAASWVVDVVCQRIPQKFGFRPLEEVQVLAPMYRSSAGVNSLNEQLQSSLNPASTVRIEHRLFGSTFRVGDKLMQIQNNYDKDVFNGDLGYLRNIETTDQQLLIEFDGRLVSYDWSEADQLVLAYAISVHKSQGSEFPVVVMPLVTQHYMMLQRNLLYTAITRAQKLCVLVGNRRAIGIAVGNDRPAQRYSALEWRLKH